MPRGRRWVGGIAGLLLAVSAGGLATGTAALAAPATAPTAALDGVGRALAQALDSPTERAWLLAAMDASPYVEHRVPLRQVLMTGHGSAPARAILDRAGLGAGEATIIAALPGLELYLSIEAQRRAWHGEAGIDVAVRQPDGSYVVNSADGSSRAVPRNHDPGARTTLTLAPSEIDYADPASAVRGGALTGEAMALRASPLPTGAIVSPLICGGPGCPPPPPPPPPSGGITTSHTQMDALYLVRDHEGLLGGLNEIEIFGNVNGFYADCGRVTGILAGANYVIPYHYPNSTLARAVPDPSHTFKLRAYEDDSQGCVVTSSDDYLGAWTTGIHLTQYGIGYRTESPGDLGLSVRAVSPFE